MVVSDRKFFYVFDCIASNKRNASGCTRAVEVVLCSAKSRYMYITGVTQVET